MVKKFLETLLPETEVRDILFQHVSPVLSLKKFFFLIRTDAQRLLFRFYDATHLIKIRI